MKISAELNYLRMSPRKVRLVADAIRGKSVPIALKILSFAGRRSAAPLAKLLRSAVANARHNFRVTEADSLTVAEVRVDGGPTLKRRRPRAMGRVFPIKKRTSHIHLTLEAGGVARRRKDRKPDVSLAKTEEIAEAKTGRPADMRETFRAKPKVATKTTGFVRRMFRRKAI